jgi:hypothetical protein
LLFPDERLLFLPHRSTPHCPLSSLYGPVQFIKTPSFLKNREKTKANNKVRQSPLLQQPDSQAFRESASQPVNQPVS